MRMQQGGTAESQIKAIIEKGNGTVASSITNNGTVAPQGGP
jgi:hypothetical protein